MQSKSKSGLKSLVELVVTVAVAVVFALLIQAFVVKPYRIPSVSMEPTLTVGQRVLANRLIQHPSVGDVVVFHPPAGADCHPVCGNRNQGEGHAQPCDTADRRSSPARRSSSAWWPVPATASRSWPAT